MFYVYELFDPRCGSTFYVGKGKNERYMAHLKEAEAGKRSRKCDMIRGILSSKNSYCWRIVSHHKDEQEAYDAEADLINEYGLENLTNILPGGGRAYQAYKAAYVRRGSRNAEEYLKSNGFKVGLKLAMIDAGYKFTLGDMDITIAIKTAISSLLDMVGNDLFKLHVPCLKIDARAI